MTSSDTDTITVGTGTITKIADPDHLTIGERGTWSIQVRLNPNVNFYNASIIDQLPAGIVPGSVRLESATCDVLGPGTCTADPIRAGPGRRARAAVRRSAGPFGDALADPSPRVVTITYSAVVADLPIAAPR